MRFLWILIWVHCQLGAVDVTGRLENGTSGGPGTAQIVQLIRLDQGMSPVGSAANVTGDFSISYDGDLAENRFLLQVIKDGVTYTQPISNPGPHEVEVFDNASEVALGSRMGSLAFFAHSDTMDIAAFIHLDNNSKPRVTYNNPAGTFSFSPPRDYSGIEASTKSSSSESSRFRRVRLSSVGLPWRPERAFGLSGALASVSRLSAGARASGWSAPSTMSRAWI